MAFETMEAVEEALPRPSIRPSMQACNAGAGHVQQPQRLAALHARRVKHACTVMPRLRHTILRHSLKARPAQRPVCGCRARMHA